MRSIAQPGAPIPERIQWVAARGRAFSFVLEAGIPLLEAVRRGFAAEGFSGGVLNATGGALGLIKKMLLLLRVLASVGHGSAGCERAARDAEQVAVQRGGATLHAANDHDRWQQPSQETQRCDARYRGQRLWVNTGGSRRKRHERATIQHRIGVVHSKGLKVDTVLRGRWRVLRRYDKAQEESAQRCNGGALGL